MKSIRNFLSGAIYGLLAAALMLIFCLLCIFLFELGRVVWAHLPGTNTGEKLHVLREAAEFLHIFFE